MLKISYRILPIILISIIIKTSSSARVLGIFCIPSLSHHLVYRALMEELANEGHDIVTVTTNPVRYNITFKGSFKEIDVEASSYKTIAETFNRSSFVPTPSFAYRLYYLYKQFIYALMKIQFEDAQVRTLFDNKTEYFDLIFIQSYCQAYFPIASHFNAPYIIFSTSMELLPELRETGKPYNPIVYPTLLSNYIGQLTFWEKLDALGLHLWHTYLDWQYSSISNDLVKKYIGSNLPSIEDALKKVSLLFLNINPIIAGVRPNVPSAIYLGGIHIKPKRELSKELKSYLDNSTQGVVYMSLGTNTQSASLSGEIIQIFMNVFDQLPYNVILKWEAETLPGKPKNVLISKWLPQRDLLAHENVKAFITQGGQQSIDEALISNVPLIGIPVALDQHRNIRHMTILGVCVALNFLTVDEESLRNAIMNVIEDQRYRTNMERLSAEVQDKQQTGLKAGVWWTEYVLRNRGTMHLRAPVMSLWEYLMLDFICLQLLFMAIVVAIVKILFRIFN